MTLPLEYPVLFACPILRKCSYEQYTIQTHASSKWYKPSALRTIQRSSPAGLAESLCAPPSPRNFQNLVFYFQILVFFFKILISSVQESGSRGFISLPNFKIWLSIFKTWVYSVGNLGIRGDGNFDFDFFFNFNVRGRYRKF